MEADLCEFVASLVYMARFRLAREGYTMRLPHKQTTNMLVDIQGSDCFPLRWRFDLQQQVLGNRCLRQRPGPGVRGSESDSDCWLIYSSYRAEGGNKGSPHAGQTFFY